jgi:hypothetical protein
MDLSLTHMLSRRTRFVLFSLLALLIPPALVAQTLGPDVPSGYLPGYISILQGTGSNGSGNSAPSTGSIGPTATAVDSQGNIWISNTTQNFFNSYVAVIYEGATPVPPILAAVTTSPQKGYIYYPVVGGGSNTGPTAGEGMPALDTYFGYINGMSFDADDNLYIADYGNDVVRRVDHDTTIVTTVAGRENTPSNGSPSIGDLGPATSATLNYPSDVRVDTAGNLYITDSSNRVVRVVYEGGAVPPILTAEGITPGSGNLVSGWIYTVAGQASVSCSGPPACLLSGTPATSGSFNSPNSTAIDTAGNLYIADEDVIDVVYGGGTVPPILSTVTSSTSPPVAGDIYTVAGTHYTTCATSPCGDGTAALSAAALFNLPLWVAVDLDGNIFVDDYFDNTIRKIDYSGYVSDVAGTESPTGALPVANETGLAISVNFNGPTTFSFDAKFNNLYVADYGNGYVWGANAQITQSITFNALSDVTYGAVHSITLDATASSGLPVSYAVTSGPGTINGSTLNITGGGTITITASQGGGTRTVNGTSTLYEAAQNQTQTLTVNPATITVTATATEVYCAPNTICQPMPQPSYLPDPSGVFTGTPGYGYPAAGTNVGTYSLPVSVGSLALVPAYQHDYTFAFVPGTITITGSTHQSITFAPLATITYGATQTVALTATTTSGLPISYTLSGSAASLSGSTLTILGAGTVTITANQPGNNIYIGAASKTQTLTINPAPLTVTAPSFTLTYGSPIAYPAPVITGFVGADTQASVISGSPIYTTTATTTSPIGTYTVTIAGLGSLTASANYILPETFGTGTLTILGDPQTISFNPLYSQVYGYPAPPPTASASSSLPVTFTLTGPAYFTNGQGGSSVGSTITTNPSAGQNAAYFGVTGVGAVTITASQAGNPQYAAAPSVTQTVTITPAPLSIVANNFTREVGAPNPVFTYQIGTNGAINGQGGGFVNGDSDVPSVIQGIPLVTTTATQDSPPGAYPIQISANTLYAPNYLFALIPGTLTILPAGSYTITSSPASLTIPAGESRQASITVTPVNLYQGTVTLSCGQLPANVTCIFSPSTYTFTGATNSQGNAANPAQGTLTVNTVGGETVAGSIAPPSSPFERASLLMLPATVGGLLLLFRRRQFAKYSAFRQMCLVAALAIGALTLSSCGSASKSSTGAIAAPGTANVVITGSGTTADGAGSVTSSMTLSVTIQ